MGQSRWADAYAQHPFQAGWTQLKEVLAAVEVDDQTVITSVYELARLKRVVAFLDQILSSIDPELTPASIWASYQQQATELLQQVRNYVSNKNIAHISAANANVDNLLTYVRPYMVLPEEAVSALKGSASAYVSELTSYIEAFKNKSISIEEQMARDKVASAENLDATKVIKSKIDDYVRQLFEGEEQTPSIQQEIERLLASANTNASRIDELHSTLIVGTPQAKSTHELVKAAEIDVVATQEKTSALLDAAQDKVKQLAIFHEKIFGKKDEETGKTSSGLEFELDARTAALRDLELEQKIKHQAMFDRIEKLLPGATSAGLATAYENLKHSFDKPIVLYTKFFYGSLGILVFAALVMAVKHVTFMPIFSIDFVEVPEWDVIFKAMLYKSPFIAPVIWLALFSSARRSQYERLQQEYAHKEALARSYESYKKQLQDLKGDSEDLQRELISKAIDCIAYNASKTLDGKHGDKFLSHQLLEKFNLDDYKKFIEFTKDFRPK